MSAKPPCLTFAAMQRLSHKRPVCKCTCSNVLRSMTTSLFQYYHTSPQLRNEMSSEVQRPPRWQQTPPAMRAPFSLREQKPFTVNEDPESLDRVYRNILGDEGDKMLADEVKWLAVTHKSFDHGRRGYNDRLAFFGTYSHK